MRTQEGTLTSVIFLLSITISPLFYPSPFLFFISTSSSLSYFSPFTFIPRLPTLYPPCHPLNISYQMFEFMSIFMTRRSVTTKLRRDGRANVEKLKRRKKGKAEYRIGPVVQCVLNNRTSTRRSFSLSLYFPFCGLPSFIPIPSSVLSFLLLSILLSPLSFHFSLSLSLSHCISAHSRIKATFFYKQ